jgi:D-alanyl-lipoteichoic acid acyltransferase DltB (MBOAT superfamily)
MEYISLSCEDIPEPVVPIRISFYTFDLIRFIVLNATFSNISAISWRPVLMVEEAGVPGKNHRPWASNW